MVSYFRSPSKLGFISPIEIRISLGLTGNMYLTISTECERGKEQRVGEELGGKREASLQGQSGL